jgi:transcription initiation factor IIE alpha subunit
LVAGAYEEQIENPGTCPTCGKPLTMECTKSGACPHQG